jgi:transcriptional regulator GlxA family with amidase domain
LRRAGTQWQMRREAAECDTPQANNMPASSKRPLRLHLLTFPQTSPLVLYGLLDVFSTVGVIYPEISCGKPGEPLFDVKVVAASREPFRCFGKVLVEPDLAIDDVDASDIVIVCDMYQPIDAAPCGDIPREAAWLRLMHQGGAMVCAVCSGTLVLAETGLLDGREAASHWGYTPTFRDYYPRVKLRSDLALCPADENARIVTTGAVTAWQDLALFIIARHCGPEHAIRTAKVYLFSHHSDGQLPYAVTAPRLQTEDALIRNSQMWVAANYAAPRPVRTMIQRSGLSPRSFARRFRAATGFAPIEYVQAVRIEEAKQLLETGSLDIDEVASAVGYEDPASFGRLFKRRAGLTPAAFRRKFAGIARVGHR